MTQAPSDLDRLFRAGVEAAGRALAAGRPLYPFALALTVDGVVVAPAVEPGEPRPAPGHVVRLLLDALRASRDDTRAAVVVTDVRLVDDAGTETSALRLELEERLGEAVVVTVPYLPGPVMQEPSRAAGRRQVF